MSLSHLDPGLLILLPSTLYLPLPAPTWYSLLTLELLTGCIEIQGNFSGWGLVWTCLECEQRSPWTPGPSGCFQPRRTLDLFLDNKHLCYKGSLLMLRRASSCPEGVWPQLWRQSISLGSAVNTKAAGRRRHFILGCTEHTVYFLLLLLRVDSSLFGTSSFSGLYFSAQRCFMAQHTIGIQ